MPFDAADLANRLMNRDVTPERLLKLRRHLARDPWSRPPVIDSAKVTALLDAIVQHPSGGDDARAFVHHSLVNQPPRELPPEPPDILEKVAAFQKKQAERKAQR